MPSEEGKQVLKLLAEGKIDADQAFRLLRALGDVEDRGSAGASAHAAADRGIPAALRGRVLRIVVMSGQSTRVNLAIPLTLARLGKTKLAASGLVRSHLAKFGIDLDEVLRSVDHAGTLVDISDNEDRVLITVE